MSSFLLLKFRYLLPPCSLHYNVLHIVTQLQDFHDKRRIVGDKDLHLHFNTDLSLVWDCVFETFNRETECIEVSLYQRTMLRLLIKFLLRIKSWGHFIFDTVTASLLSEIQPGWRIIKMMIKYFKAFKSVDIIVCNLKLFNLSMNLKCENMLLCLLDKGSRKYTYRK